MFVVSFYLDFAVDLLVGVVCCVPGGCLVDLIQLHEFYLDLLLFGYCLGLTISMLLLRSMFVLLIC